CCHHLLAVTIYYTRYADAEHFISFGVNIVHRIDGKRRCYAIHPNNRLGGFGDIISCKPT
ncbi:hypothetical protein J8A08_23590, partial [Vibrio parahaemolyticus]|nr:hypothetical protein [Vibrio parahaemolyticus]